MKRIETKDLKAGDIFRTLPDESFPEIEVLKNKGNILHYCYVGSNHPDKLPLSDIQEYSFLVERKQEKAIVNLPGLTIIDCKHSNKYKNHAGGILFWYCPNCKSDLGNA